MNTNRSLSTRGVPAGLALLAACLGCQQHFTAYFPSGQHMEFVLVPAGEFLMGSPDTDGDGYPNETPQHTVRISRPFYMSKYEVTQDQWKDVMGYNPSFHQKRDSRGRYPVENVSWDECQVFCKKMTDQLETESIREIRLPTEAEWEYACRAGTTTRYFLGDMRHGLNDKAGKDVIHGHFPDSFYTTYDALPFSGVTLPYYELVPLSMNITTCKASKPNPVGQTKWLACVLPPLGWNCRPNVNGWGLADMHGNVWEWCQDRYVATYPAEDQVDPCCDASDSEFCVIRGGAYNTDVRDWRSACRSAARPNFHHRNLGFRIVGMPNDVACLPTTIPSAQPG